MFYQTTLRYVGTYNAVDVYGKSLRFIGYLPVQPGDTVWTDGNVIFGNVPPRSLSVDGIISGIPVLGDGDLCGYVGKSGKIRSYKVKEDDWIVNNKKTFEHGKDDFGDGVIIDSEITDEQDLITVKSGFYQKGIEIVYWPHLYCPHIYIPKSQEGKPTNTAVPYAVAANVDTMTDYGLVLGNTENKDIDVIFHKNGEEFNRVNLKKYADNVEDFALQFVLPKVLALSVKDDDAFNWTNQPDPPQNSIVSSYARVVMMHVSPNGDWDAVISASAYGYAFIYLTAPSVSVFFGSFANGEDKIFSSDLLTCATALDKSLWEENNFPFLSQIQKYPDFSGTKTSSGDYTAEYKQYILDKIAYYIPLVKFKYYLWYPAMFSACRILRVHNGEITDIIEENYTYGAWHQIEFWDEKSTGWQRSWEVPEIKSLLPEYSMPIRPKSVTWQFPIDDDYYFKAKQLDIQAIYDSKGKKVFDVTAEMNRSIHDKWYSAYATVDKLQMGSIYALKPYMSYYANDPDNWHNKEILLPIVWMTKFDAGDALNDNDIGKTQDSSFPLAGQENLRYLSGWFKDEGTPDEYGEVLINCFTPLTKNKFLLGARKGKLCLIDAEQNSFEDLGDNLKNFRLFKLNNMAKAKK